LHSEYVEAVLRLNLPASHRCFLQIKQVRALPNPRLEREFETASAGLTIVDGWLYAWSTDDVDAVCKGGFRAMQGGPMRFGLYMVTPEVPQNEGMTLKMVLCKVAVGKSVFRTPAGMETITEVPKGYQSIYVPGEQPEEGVPVQEMGFVDTYTLFDAELALPTHVVEFKLSKDAARVSKDYSICESCGQGRAVVYSLQSNTKLCAACDLAAHASPYTCRFSRLTLEGTKDSDDYRFNCTTNRVVQASDMESPEFRGHMFLTLDDAFNQMKANMLELEAEVDGLRAAIAGLNSTTNRNESETHDRANLLKQELSKYLVDYMLTLQVSEERRCDIKRTLHDVISVSDFMQMKRTTMTKVAMLNVWKNLECQRVDLQMRLGKLSRIPANAMEMLTLSQKDRQIEELDRQVEQKERVVQLLKSRLKDSGSALTETDMELLAM